MADLDWIDQLKVVELRKRLKDLGETSTGKKAILVERLKEKLSQQAPAGQEPAAGQSKEAAASPTSGAVHEEEEEPNPAMEVEVEDKKEGDQGGLDALLGDGKDDLEFDFDTEKPQRKKQKIDDKKDEVTASGVEVDVTGEVTKTETEGANKDAIQEETKLESSTEPSHQKTEEIVEAPEVPSEERTRALHIQNFVRPFTEKAAKEMLSEFGTVEEMWMPTIKTHCYVIFENAEVAQKAYLGTYNVVWPRHGKNLTSRFVNEEEAKQAIEDGRAQSNYSRASGMSSYHKQRSLPPPPLPPPPQQQSVPSNQAPRAATKQSLSLEDLFFKTQAKPHIYYLPLTDEEVTAKKQALHEKDAETRQDPKTDVSRD